MRRRSVLGLGLAAALPPAARAQDYPRRPIRVIVSYPAGGASDILARAIGERLQPKLGQPFIVDNRPGANEIVGAQTAMSAAPDGYTYLWGTSSLATINPVLRRNLPYNPDTTFEPVSLLFTTREFLIVSARLGVSTLEELIGLAQRRPDQINCASFGEGTLGHLQMLGLQQATGTRFNHVPYRGMAQIVPDLLADRVQMVVTSPFSVVPQINDGTLKVLALSADERAPSMPDVPTFRERGIDLSMPASLGLFAPRGTPREYKERLATEIAAVIRTPEFQERYTEAQHLVPVGSDAAAFAAFLAASRETVARIVRTAGLAPLE